MTLASLHPLDPEFMVAECVHGPDVVSRHAPGCVDLDPVRGRSGRSSGKSQCIFMRFSGSSPPWSMRAVKRESIGQPGAAKGDGGPSYRPTPTSAQYLDGSSGTSSGESGRHWGIQTRPGSRRVKPSHSLVISSRLRMTSWAVTRLL